MPDYKFFPIFCSLLHFLLHLIIIIIIIISTSFCFSFFILELPLPDHWDSMDNTDYLKVELQPGSEYDSVKNCFPTTFTIVKVSYLFIIIV